MLTRVNVPIYIQHAVTIINNRLRQTRKFIHVHSNRANDRFSEGDRQEERKAGERGVGEREGGCDMIYNEIINLEKQNGLCDINTISETNTLLEQYHVYTHRHTHRHRLMYEKANTHPVILKITRLKPCPRHGEDVMDSH